MLVLQFLSYVTTALAQGIQEVLEEEEKVSHIFFLELGLANILALLLTCFAFSFFWKPVYPWGQSLLSLPPPQVQDTEQSNSGGC